MGITEWLTLAQVQVVNGWTWLVCTQCGTRMGPVTEGETIADLYLATGGHEHAQ